MEDQKRKSNVSGYPLGALFLLVTASGLLAGCASIGARDLLGLFTGVAWTIGEVTLLCAIWGLVHQGRAAGFFVGGLVGAVLGAGCGTVAIIRPPQFFEVLVISIISSVLILVIALVMGRPRKRKTDRRTSNAPLNRNAAI